MHLSRLIVTLMVIAGVVGCSNKQPDSVDAELQMMLDATESVLGWTLPRHINNPAISNARVNRMVARGISSNNDDVVERTLRKLNDYATRVKFNLTRGTSTPLPREVHLVPGLKDFLIDRWEKKFAELTESTYNSGESVQTMLRRLRLGIPSIPKAWVDIPHVLAAIYPNDDAVHEVIWQNHDPQAPEDTLVLLSVGGFVTPEANSYRILMLFLNPEDLEEELGIHFPELNELGEVDASAATRASSIAGVAAQGLGVCQSDEGYNALLRRFENLKNSDDLELVSFVVDSIVAYGERALSVEDDLIKTALRFGITSSSAIETPSDATLLFSFLNEDGVSKYRLHSALKQLNALANVHATEAS